MVKWMRWHCPPDTGFEIRALTVWGRARYLSVTEGPHNTSFTSGWGRNIVVSFKPPRPGDEPRTLTWKAVVLTTILGPPPLLDTERYKIMKWKRKNNIHISIQTWQTYTVYVYKSGIQCVCTFTLHITNDSEYSVLFFYVSQIFIPIK